MKKMIGLALAVLLVAGMAASVAVADDRLQLNGEMRVRYWNKDYGSSQSQDYFDQRLRVGATLNVADGVKIITRMDLAEGTWGHSSNNDGWMANGKHGNSKFEGEDSEFQIDRAYIQVDRGLFGIAAGQQNILLGNGVAYDNQGTGFKLDIKTPVVITLGYTKESEGSEWAGGYSNSDRRDTDDVDKDIDTYLINLGHKADNFSVNAFYAAAFDDINGARSFEPRVFGLQGTFTTGILSFNGEVNYFDGDAFGYDVTGVQAWVNMEAAVLDNLKVGIDLVWSKGNDDADKIKLTAMNDWNNISYMDRGPFNTMVLPGGTSDMFDPLSPLLAGSPMGSNNWAFNGNDPKLAGKSEMGAQGGSIGGGVYAIFTPVENVNVFAQVMYLEPEDDGYYEAVTGVNDALWNSALLYSIGASWTFAPNTTLSAQYHRTDWDSDIDALDDSCDVITAMLKVTF